MAFLPLASRGPTYGRLLLALALDPRVPASRKALLILAAGYVLSPLDLISDRIPVLGALDDIAVIVLAVDLFLDGLPAGLIDEKLAELGMQRSELDEDLRRVRRTIPAPVRAAVARVPEALETVADVARSTGLDERVQQLVAGLKPSDRGADGDRRSWSQMEEVPA